VTQRHREDQQGEHHGERLAADHGEQLDAGFAGASDLAGLERHPAGVDEPERDRRQQLDDRLSQAGAAETVVPQVERLHDELPAGELVQGDPGQ